MLTGDIPRQEDLLDRVLTYRADEPPGEAHKRKR